jgi:phospholipase C
VTFVSGPLLPDSTIHSLTVIAKRRIQHESQSKNSGTAGRIRATLAPAQTLPHFDHIIIVVQENRTPDNLFGSTPTTAKCQIAEDPFEPGVDIENRGALIGHTGPVCSTPRSIADPLNQGHFYINFTNQWDRGNMDGTCMGRPDRTVCFAYVPRAEADPYFQIAINYGFANYMFQTNEGPSFPAHQFLL